MGIKTFDRANPELKQIETYSDFTGGLNTEQASSKMKDNQFRELINFDMDLGGSLTKRPGLYRIKGVEKSLEQAYQNAVPDYVDKLPLRVILDCHQFFDGVNWIFNFITNQGLGVVILNKNLDFLSPNHPLDENDNPILSIDKNYLFYTNIIDNIKISAYSDYYILMTTKYLVQPAEESPDKKQITLYSWNPIPFNPLVGQTNEKEWIEASTNLEDTASISYYGGSESSILTQLTPGLPISELPSLEIEIVDDSQKLPEWDMFVKYSIEVNYNPDAMSLDFSFISDPTNVSAKSNYQFKLPAVYGWSNSDLAIHQMVATLYDSYYYFTFYHPSTNLILSLKLKEVLTGIFTEEQIKNMEIISQIKPAFNKVHGVSSSTQRAENFSMNENGVLCDVQGDTYNSGPSWGPEQTGYSEDYVNSYNWPNELLVSNGNDPNDSLVFPKDGNSSIFPNISAGNLRVVGHTKNNVAPPAALSERNHIVFTSSLLSTDANKWESLNIRKIPNIRRSNYGFSTQYIRVGLNGAESIHTGSAFEGELTVPKIILSKDVKENNLIVSLLPYINYHNPGAFWTKFLIDANRFETSAIKSLYTQLSPIYRHLLNVSNFKIPIILSNDYTIGKYYYTSKYNYAEKYLSNQILDKYLSPQLILTFPLFVANGQDPDPKDNNNIISLGYEDTTDYNHQYVNIITISGYSQFHDLNFEFATHTIYKNRDTNIYSVGFAYTGSTVNIKITDSFGNVQSTQFKGFKFAGLLNNNLFISSFKNQSSFVKLLELNGQKSFVDKFSKDFTWTTFLGETTMTGLEESSQYLKQEVLSLFRLTYIWQDSSNNRQNYDPNINQETSLKLLEYILKPDSYFTIYTIKSSSGVINYLKISVFISINEEIVLLDTNKFVDIPISEYSAFAETMLFTFASIFYPDGLINNVVQFKRLTYTKPNLNDLGYLWYNFVLFNKYKNTTNPNIYNKTLFPSISTDLVQYPTNQELTRPVQLYGLVPVNQLILSPGDNQRFQIFFGIKVDAPSIPEDEKLDIRVSLSAMPLSDYTAMLLSKEFTTEKTLTWAPWSTLFPDPDLAVWEVSIPSTTSPYILVVQAANFTLQDPEIIPDGETPAQIKRIDLSTVVETRLEMSPQSNVSERIDIPALFDELTASSHLRMFETSSSIVAFGASNKIFFSDIAVPSYFPVSSIIQLKTPEPIVSTVMFQNKLIVSTKNSRHYIGGTSFDAPDSRDRHNVKLISSDSGIVSSKFDVPFGDSLYFLDNNGIKKLKNLYGTADKEFTFQEVDLLIKSKVRINDLNAVAIAHRDKLYINFPSSQTMLIYTKQYDSWLEYKSPLMDFSTLFAKDGELFAVSRFSFNIYRFDKNVMVDGWNEEEDGYEIWTAPDGTKHQVQKGTPIECIFETKNLDQAYTPHRKKYKSVTINATLIGAQGVIIPIIKVDNIKVNYRFYLREGTESTWEYARYEDNDSKGINLVSSPMFTGYDRSKITGGQSFTNFVLGQSILGETKDVYYSLPVGRTGNTLSLEFKFNTPSVIIINELSVRYSLRLPKTRRGGR